VTVSEIALPEAGRLRPLFATHRELRAIVDAVLEGRLGSAAAGGDPPRAARLSLGCYEVFGGDPTRAEARRLVETAASPRELIYGNDPAWRRTIIDVHGERVFDRPMRTYDASTLDLRALARIKAELAPSFELRRLDLSLAEQLDTELQPHGRQVFSSPDDLLARGMGWAAVSGDRLACAATSYTISSRFVEVAIATRPAFRGRGLAAVVSAALLEQCLEAGLVPEWSASNPVSQRLALRLGYAPGGECEVLYLRPLLG
jgi:GNAT superfamily N-acetyltransferase